MPALMYGLMYGLLAGWLAVINEACGKATVIISNYKVIIDIAGFSKS